MTTVPTTNDLPADLREAGFVLVVFAPGRLCASSPNRGCTETLPTLEAVIAQARTIKGFCEYVERKRATNDGHIHAGAGRAD